jgi:hypothetical protein
MLNASMTLPCALARLLPSKGVIKGFVELIDYNVEEECLKVMAVRRANTKK